MHACPGADFVYRNDVTHNTGGILVFNLPGLPVKDGRKTRVFENHVYANDTGNFAPKGNIVATVPTGTGFMVLANDEIEFFHNKVEDNRTANVLILSFNSTGKPANDPQFDPYPQRIAIHDNQFRGGGDSPDQIELKAMKLAKSGLNGRLPDILWDGSAPQGQDAAAMQICIRNNGPDNGVGNGVGNSVTGFANIDYAGRLAGFSNESQTEATLELTGAVLSLELVSHSGRTPFAYVVPDTNQCADCHSVDSHKQAIKPIGVRARHLNKDYQYARTRENQLTHWSEAGLLTGAGAPDSAPRNAQWDIASSGDVAARARAYLDVNCGHCHSARGAANTSGLLLNARETDPVRLGLCKIPVATGRGSGTASFDIVPGAPDESILLHRMQSTEADVAMPELGRSLVHAEAVALIREWIGSLSGSCAAS